MLRTRFSVSAASIDQLLKVLGDVIAPLIRADGGEVYIVAVEPNHLSLHLAGRYAGCPGAPLVVRGIIEPAVRSVAPTARLEVSSGIHVPEGAWLVGSSPEPGADRPRPAQT